MEDPTARNRLADEESPYLRQHADNPVNWQPWDGPARRAAADRDVPIFLSIGYAACHWCHVMEEESFVDEDVARALNDWFVPIKVDREERPDLDTLYQTICQLVTGHGGWPLSAWLTPDGRPFYVGTYFPRDPARGMPGFLDLLERIGESWREERDQLETRADRWAEAVAEELESVPSPTTGDETAGPPTDLLDRAVPLALRAADRRHGGFGESGPKFPQPARLELLVRAVARGTDSDRGAGDGAAHAVLMGTLDAMANGGLYDHVGGGFHRYATDRTWTVPHFEKMLYDNAALPRLYVEGYRLTGRERYARVVRETLAFVERELAHPDGGYVSSLDAESEGEEGRYYVWTPDEVEAALDDPDLAALVRERYGVTEAGNFEGRTVLTLDASIETLADRHGLAPATVRDRLETARTRMAATRERRPRPARDDKVLAGWNGLLLSALSEAGLALDTGYAEQATSALDFLRDTLWDADEGRLYRRYADGVVRIPGYLDDHAFLGRGAFDCYQLTGDVEHLRFAIELARTIVASFWDEGAGTLYFTPSDGEDLLARPQELTDTSTPSSVGVAADLLLSLDPFVPSAGFADVVERLLATHADRLEAGPLEHPSLVLAADRLTAGSIEVTVAADRVPERWLSRLGRLALPGRILALRPPTQAGLDRWLSRLDLDGSPPIWAERSARDDRPTAYVCRAFTCSPPLDDIEDVEDWIDELGGSAKGDSAPILDPDSGGDAQADADADAADDTRVPHHVDDGEGDADDGSDPDR